MKSRCIITSKLNPGALHAELSHVAEYFSTQAHGSCKILFGFAWGNEYYPGDWIEERVSLGSLTEKVRSVESSGLGHLGRDDLFVTIADLEFQFCHESDLHLEFDERTQVVKHFFNRWGELGFNPAEWICDDKGAPETKVRAYVA